MALYKNDTHVSRRDPRELMMFLLLRVKFWSHNLQEKKNLKYLFVEYFSHINKSYNFYELIGLMTNQA